MPTLILLDVSLSMSRILPVADAPNESSSIKDLAVTGLLTFLDHISNQCKLEFTSLMLFSSLWEKSLGFTRDYESVKARLLEIDSFFDKTNIVNALEGVREMVLEEWGQTTSVPINVILVTDGCAGMKSIQTDSEPIKLPSMPFPCKLHVVCLAPSNDPILSTSLPFYKRLITSVAGGRMGGNTKCDPDPQIQIPDSQVQIPDSQVWIPDSQVWIPEGSSLSIVGVNNIFTQIANQEYQTWKGRLHCGRLSCPVSLFPPIEPRVQVTDFCTIRCEANQDIRIIGFMDIAEVASPPVLSRHLMLPVAMSREQFLSTQPSVFNLEGSTIPLPDTGFDLESDESGSEEGKQASLCVLLHGALKVEGMIALCQLSPDWYGMLYSWADSKKKFNLMLSTFNGGEETVPWLYNLSNIGNPLTRVTPLEKRIGCVKSYSQNVVVWIKQSGLQADVQKVVRLAKKLPDKTSNFYRELSRFRKAAASFGFYDALTGLADLLDRERQSLLPNSESDLQLAFAIECLRSSEGLELDIPPLKTPSVMRS